VCSRRGPSWRSSPDRQEERTLTADLDRTIRENVTACARIADEKQAEDVVILDLRGLTSVTDYFLIATGRNPRQLDAIAEEILRFMKRRHHRPLGVEGQAFGHWVLLDYGDFVVHLFDPEHRRLYDLELLWGDAGRVSWR